MKIVMGPVLGFRELRDSQWKLCALVVTEGSEPPEPLHWSTASAKNSVDASSSPLMRWRDRQVWCYDFAVEQKDAMQVVQYKLSGSGPWEFFVPSRAEAPRMAYASCNGFSNPRDMKKVKDQNALWKDMYDKHKEKKFHLLLMGGDQVYADAIWEVIPCIKQWTEVPIEKRRKRRFTKEMNHHVQQFYFDLYCKRWAQPGPKDMLARVPTLMMWDDHDIFDGYGSYPDEDQACPVYRGIFKHAREHFRVFQRRLAPDDMPGSDPNDPDDSHFENPPDLSYFNRLGDIAIATLDLRSQRTQKRVLRDDAWTKFLDWMDAKEDLKHLIVMSSIPVVHSDLSLADSLLSLIPGEQELEDDLKDRWHSRTHMAERIRLIHRLLAFSNKSRTRVTLLSGDVHVAAVGVIESERLVQGKSDNANVINQLTSSAIVHPAPHGLVVFGMELLSTRTEDVDRGITARMLKFPGTQNRLIGARNWLSMEGDEKYRIWANWHVEGAEEPFTKVIHPCKRLGEVDK